MNEAIKKTGNSSLKALITEGGPQDAYEIEDSDSADADVIEFSDESDEQSSEFDFEGIDEGIKNGTVIEKANEELTNKLYINKSPAGRT